MPPPQQHTNHFVITVNRNELPAPIVGCLVSAFVDDSLNQPDMFEITFRDPHRTVLAEGHFKIGATVAVKVFSDAYPTGEELIKGEVTSLEAEYEVGGTMTTIRGLDRSHRLFRGRFTETYKNASYSDVAKKVAQRVGLEVGTIDSSSPVHPHVTQANVSDWHFLAGMAAEIGFEIGCVDGKFNFRQPTESAAGPAKGNLRSEDPLQLTLGHNLLSFRATVTAADQVKSVEVRGWDMEKKQAIVGTAEAKTTSASVDVQPSELAGLVGGVKYISVHTPFTTQTEADTAAKAMADQIAGAFAEFEGVARGNPKLRAGKVVSLSLVDSPFDGKYLVTTTRHVHSPDTGYTVWFTVSGRQDRSLYGLVAANGSNGSGSGPNHPVHGVVIGIVTNNDDPKKLGRVKLNFPWLSKDHESDWARGVAAGAGGDRGTVILPEVNDEVLVAFEHGDVRSPYVIGGLYNGKDKPKLGDDLVKNGKVQRRGFISRKGHKLVFLDGDSRSGVMVATSDNGLRIALSKNGKTIRIVSNGKVEIEAKDNIVIKAGAKMELKATAGISIDGGPAVDVTGKLIKLN